MPCKSLRQYGGKKWYSILLFLTNQSPVASLDSQLASQLGTMPLANILLASHRLRLAIIHIICFIDSNICLKQLQPEIYVFNRLMVFPYIFSQVPSTVPQPDCHCQPDRKLPIASQPVFPVLICSTWIYAIIGLTSKTFILHPK